MKEFILLVTCLFICGLSFAETSTKSKMFAITMDDVKVIQQYPLNEALNFGINLSQECRCKVTIVRPDKSTSWSKLLKTKAAWKSPTKTESGDYLKDVDFYIISYWRYGYNELFITVIGEKDEQTINDLLPGDWVFRIKAVDTDGLESGWSDLTMVSV